MCKVSVITINLNNAAGIQLTLESIYQQTYTNYELIVIDGGSTDESLEIIRRYVSTFNMSKKNNKNQCNLYWVSEKDKGVYHAQNKGIIKSTGEYCFFLNSGDVFVDANVLENVFKNKIDSDIIFGNLIVRDKNNKVIGKWYGKDDLTFLDIYNSSLKHQASFIKRNLFEKYGLYNESLKIIADWEFFIKATGLGDATIKYIDVDIAYFDNDGISNNSANICITERKQILEKYLPLRVRADYDNFSIYFAYNRIMKYKLTTFLLRALNKATKIYESIFNL